MKTVLTTRALRDVEAIAQWHETQREDLADAFLDHVQDGLSRINLNPLAYRKVSGENRRCNLAGFPYALYFRITGEAMVVVCLHAEANLRKRSHTSRK